MTRSIFLIWLCVIPTIGFLSAQSLPHVTPPAPYAVTVTQPDGSLLEVIARGDAYHNWMETTDGYTVLKTARGTYEFAEIVQGKLVSSGIQADDPSKRTLLQSKTLRRFPKGLIPQKIVDADQEDKMTLPLSDPQARLGSAGVMPSSGSVKVLAILIEFPDLKHKYEKATFNTFFNGPSSKPTFKSYYEQNSHQKFSPTVEVVGWYQAAHDYDYYGEQHGKSRSRELVDEAIAAAEADGVDFSKYDNNSDDYADGVIIVHAGQGAEEGSQKEFIWSHRWAVSAKFLDNTWVKDYTIQPEVRVRYNSLVRIGVFCHEFGHLLGLPDLYDTDETDDKHNGIGEWGLMGTGGWVGSEEYPAGMTAFSKAMLGWGNVQDITEKGGSYQISPAHSSGQIYKINTQNDHEYFLLENRQRGGTDEYINGAGLAIWHINTEQTKKYPGSIHVNNQVDRKGVDLEEADGKDDLDFRRNRGDDGDFFPGSSKRTQFDQGSDPNTDLYDDLGDGLTTDIAIKNIALAGEIISFDYNKEENTEGSSCDEAVAAKEGENTLPKTAYWYTFTMPKDGSVVISDANAKVYAKCGDNTPLAFSQSNRLETARLKKGETVKILFEGSQPKSLPLIWKLSINSTKADPQLKLSPVANKTYGDAPFALEVTRQGTGTITYTKVSGPIEVSGNNVSIQGAGEATLKVALAESDTHAAAEQEVTFTIAKASQIVTFAEIANKTYGDEPFALEASSNRGLPLTLSVVKGKVSIEGNTVTISGAGAVELRAVSQENSNYQTASATRSFTVAKADQEITFEAIDDMVYEKDKVIELKANTSTGLPVSYTVEDGEAKLEGSKLWIQQAGEVTVVARQVGNDNYESVSSAQTFEVEKASQTISFAEIGNKTYGDEPFSLEASSDSGLPLTFSVVKGKVSIDGNTVTITGAGAVELRAVSQENSNYQTASATRSFTVAKADQEITFEAISDKQLGDSPFILRASSNAALPVSFRVISGNAEIDEDEIILTGNGEIVIEAYNEGNNNYLPQSVEQSFVVAEPDKFAQTITLGALPDTVVVNNQVALDIQISSALNPDIEIIGSAIREGQTITFTQVGEVTVKVGQPGNDEYNPAKTVSHTFVVVNQSVVENPLGTARQSLSFQPIENKTFGAAPFPLDVQSSSGLAVTYQVEGPAEVVDGVVTILGAGRVTVRAFQAGNEEFAPSDTVVMTFDVAKAPQSIVFEVVPLSNTTFRLEASSDSGLPVTLHLDEGNGTIENDLLTVLESGAITVVARQDGDANYLAADPISRVIEAEIITALNPDYTSPEIVIYPNPSDGVFRVKVPAEGLEIPYEVYNLAGAQILKGALNGIQPSIDLSPHRSGTYVIQLRTAAGLHRYRLIKL